MKKLLLTAVATGIAALALTAKSGQNDPVVMTIDGRDVKLSEFEYLYNKNNSQQLTPLTFDQYVDMFVNYKLKVADALNAKLDTTAAFTAEFDKFRRDLAQPYLRDTELEEQLVQEVYSHNGEDVYVSHIMLAPMTMNATEKLDSLRQLITNGDRTFEEIAEELSVDRNSAVRGGLMGWVTANSQYPWAFEKASYDTPVGEISQPVNSGFGFHLIRPEMRRPSRGEVLVQHILLLTRDLDENAQEAKRQEIDSIYQLAISGTDFSDLAKRLSEDPGSARDGGMLDWFGAGRMVAEFDSVAFALPNGAISEPFKTSYGYHIIHKVDSRGPLSMEEMRPLIEKAIESDSRKNEPLKSNINKAAEATGSKLLTDYRDEVRNLLAQNNNRVDTVLIGKLKSSNAPAYKALGREVTLGEVMANVPLRPTIPAPNLMQAVDKAVENAFDSVIIDYEIDQLMYTEPEYTNLVNEYRDGILLFDISNEKVWDKASKDKAAQKEYFEANKAKYQTWTAPKYKAYVLLATSDSILQEIKTYAEANYGGKKLMDIDQETFTKDLKDCFGKNVKIERVIAAKGDNAITDFLGFGIPIPENKYVGMDHFMAFAGEMIDQPEEVSDCKGAVISDYQNALEQEWVDQLRKQYKVKIDKKALKQANKDK